jgi:cellobiose phosphorylase
MEIDGAWHLLGLPSAFEIRPDRCRWIYRHAGGLVEVVATAPERAHRLEVSVTVLEGPPARFLFSHHVALNGDDGSGNVPARWEIRESAVFLKAVPDSDVGRRFPEGGFFIRPSDGTKPESIGGDELLFSDGLSRKQPFLCIITGASRSAGLTIEGRLVESTVSMENRFWESMGAGLRIEASADAPLAGAVARAAAIFPWFAHNALVHYLSPRGLEQYSGGGWGTRDVCQGPVELLLALGRFDPIRDLLCRVFRQQNPDGDWPQWFMFFDRERGIRPGDSHGDIVYWPVLALAQYLEATGDTSLLEVELPFFHPDGDSAAEMGTILQHVERALGLIERRVIPGTRLAAYGHGDWNDSLQPARPDMRENLCSSWTVTLNYQTLTTLAAAFRKLGRQAEADVWEAKAAEVLEQFQRVLVVDGVIAGLAYFHPDGKTDHLLHPRDRTTGLSYSVLPIIHAIINGMLTPAQAAEHLAIIREHLLGPDGARLFDRPMRYHGGPQRYFQRAESASFFGREIGIMYTHAHLRYCEALARFGDAGAFFHALRQAIPIGLRDIVPRATMRQSNCYFSSSDAAFADRYDAFENYGRVKRGEVPLEGGWRVYSSGAGIASRLIVQCLLGLRVEMDALILDPVIPAALDGLHAEAELAGRKFKLSYHVAEKGRGPIRVQLNSQDLAFTRDPNPYRTGAARIPVAWLPEANPGSTVDLHIWLE